MSTCVNCRGQEALPTRSLCASCWAEYMRKYRMTQKVRQDRRAFVRGQESMRSAIIAMFEGVGEREMNGRTAVVLVRQCSES